MGIMWAWIMSHRMSACYKGTQAAGDDIFLSSVEAIDERVVYELLDAQKSSKSMGLKKRSW